MDVKTVNCCNHQTFWRWRFLNRNFCSIPKSCFSKKTEQSIQFYYALNTTKGTSV